MVNFREIYHYLDYKPLINGDTFRNFQIIFLMKLKSFNPKSVKSKDVIFVNADLLRFKDFEIIHPKISNRYILITHNSDREISINEIKLADNKINLNGLLRT